MYEFARLDAFKQSLALKEEGLFLEKYKDGEYTIYVYYLDGFFVEATFKEKQLIDLIPFKRGYKLNKQDRHNLEKRNVLYYLAA